METLWQIMLLAVVQGVAEFLPISSSGHLVIVNWILQASGYGLPDISDINIVLHCGTLLSIAVFYFHRIRRLLGEDRRIVVLLIIGTIPAVVVGLPLKLLFDEVLKSTLLAGWLLIVTGAMLLWIGRREAGDKEYQQLSWLNSFWIGLAQAAAVLPGLSRSGSTISAGLVCGLSSRSAATFSFLLAIPVIAGAGVLELGHLVGDRELSTPIAYLGVGVAVSFTVGLASLWWLVRWLERGRLQWFAFWCIPAGVAVILFQLLGPAA